MVSRAARTAALEVLRRWRQGRLLLGAYAVAMTPALWLLAFLDHRLRDLLAVAAVLAAASLVLLTVVSLRNAAAGEALGRHRADLDGPDVPDEPRSGLWVWGTGGGAYVMGLLAVVSSGFFVQTAVTNGASSVRGTAEVTGCDVSHGRYGSSTTCHGRWTVNGKTYSGTLPDVESEGLPVTVRFDPDHPAALDDRSLTFPVTSLLLTGGFTVALTAGWLTRSRGPSLAAVAAVSGERTRDAVA